MVDQFTEAESNGEAWSVCCNLSTKKRVVQGNHKSSKHGMTGYLHLLLNLQANGRVRHSLGETTPFYDGKVKESKELRQWHFHHWGTDTKSRIGIAPDLRDGSLCTVLGVAQDMQQFPQLLLADGHKMWCFQLFEGPKSISLKTALAKSWKGIEAQLLSDGVYQTNLLPRSLELRARENSQGPKVQYQIGSLAIVNCMDKLKDPTSTLHHYEAKWFKSSAHVKGLSVNPVASWLQAAERLSILVLFNTSGYNP